MTSRIHYVSADRLGPQILIDNIEVDYIINVGVAGGISKDIKICDVVIGNKLIQHDFDLRPFNYERGYIPNVGQFINCDAVHQICQQKKRKRNNRIISVFLRFDF